MSQPVKCLYCNKYFDKDLEDYSKVGRRYAHYKCYCEKQDKPEDKDSKNRRKLTDLIQGLYFPYEPDWKMIGTQMRKYKLEGMTYDGMRLTLEYFYNIKHNKVKKEQGIGIIPYQYKRAQQYYQNLDNTNAQTQKIQQEDTVNVNQTQETVIIENAKIEKKLIDFTY